MCRVSKVISRRVFVFKVRFIARYKAVIGWKVLEKNVVINALPIFQATKLNLTGIIFFSLVDNVAILGNSPVKKFVGTIELKTPNDISGVFDISGFFEGFKGNAL